MCFLFKSIKCQYLRPSISSFTFNIIVLVSKQLPLLVVTTTNGRLVDWAWIITRRIELVNKCFFNLHNAIMLSMLKRLLAWINEMVWRKHIKGTQNVVIMTLQEYVKYEIILSILWLTFEILYWIVIN